MGLTTNERQNRLWEKCLFEKEKFNKVARCAKDISKIFHSVYGRVIVGGENELVARLEQFAKEITDSNSTK